MNDTPRIIEILGPPGSGKSTLARNLRGALPNNSIESFPYYRRIDCLPYFIENSFSLLPALSHLKREADGRWLTPRDLVSMIILNGWHKVLQKKQAERNTILLLDEGGITILAWLNGFGSAYMQSAAMRDWWQNVYSAWAQTIDLVIQLQSPIPVLLERVRERDHHWDVYSDAEALDMLTKLELSQNQALSRLAAFSASPRIIQVQAHGKTQMIILDEVIRQLVPFFAGK